MPENGSLQHAQKTQHRATSRRALIATAAWSAPVIALAVAAPARAASTTARCLVTTNYNDLTLGETPTTIPFVDSKPATTMELDYVGADGWNSSPTNGSVQEGPKGGISKNWIKFENIEGPRHHDYRTAAPPEEVPVEVANEEISSRRSQYSSGVAYRSSLTVTMTFSRPVSELRFTLFDLDWVRHGYRDAVRVITEPTSVELGPGLEGDGSQRSPWQKAKVGEISSESLNGNVSLYFKGPITEVSFVYFQNSWEIGKTPNQLIGLSDVRFEECV